MTMYCVQVNLFVSGSNFKSVFVTCSYKERGGHRSASPSISLSSEENMYQVKLKSLKKQLSEKVYSHA